MNTPPDLITLLRGLIERPSISSVSPDYDSGNLAVIEYLAQWLEALGFDIEIMPLPGHTDKANLIATLGRGPGGLILAGHTDTVPFDEGRWQHDPFRLVEADQRLYGLGTSDMKGFFALVIEAVRDLRARDLKEPLVILATADEESSMEGARLLVDQGRPRARRAIIGEPTGLRPVHAHKGIMMEAIRLTGRAGHSSDPSLGISALEGMQTAMTAILDWRRELQTRHRDPAFAVPVPTLNLGHIHGGDNPNRICGSCELHIDLRPLPGMQPDALREELRHRLELALADTGLGIELESLFPGIPAMHTDRQAEIVRTAERLTGHSADTVAFGTEAPYLAALGIEPLVLGPGDIAQAHQPDEYLALDRLQPTVTLLRRLIDRFCIHH